MSDVVVDERFHQLMRQHSLTEIARILRKRYSSVRDAAKAAGYDITRGRPPGDKRRQRYRRQAISRLAAGESVSSVAREMNLPEAEVAAIQREIATESIRPRGPQAEPPAPPPTDDPS